MIFTRRPTGLGNPADFVFRYEGKDIGRCYRGLFGSHGHCWHWTIFGTSREGFEPTLEVAQEKFKAAYLEWREQKRK